MFWLDPRPGERASEREEWGEAADVAEGGKEGEKKFLEGGSSTKFLKGIVRDAPVPCAVRSCAFFTSSPPLSLSLSFSIGSHQVPFSFNRGLTNARLVSRNHSTSLLVFEERDRVSIPPREKTRAWRVLLFPHLFVFKFRLSLSFSFLFTRTISVRRKDLSIDPCCRINLTFFSFSLSMLDRNVDR